jgi:hypothetical protein
MGFVELVVVDEGVKSATVKTAITGVEMGFNGGCRCWLLLSTVKAIDPGTTLLM